MQTTKGGTNPGEQFFLQRHAGPRLTAAAAANALLVLSPARRARTEYISDVLQHRVRRGEILTQLTDLLRGLLQLLLGCRSGTTLLLVRFPEHRCERRGKRWVAD